LRRDDHVVVAAATVDQRELAGVSALPAGRVEDEAVRSVPVVAHLAASGLVLADVLVAKESAVVHGVSVPHAGRWVDPQSWSLVAVAGAGTTGDGFSIRMRDQTRAALRRASEHAERLRAEPQSHPARGPERRMMRQHANTDTPPVFCPFI